MKIITTALSLAISLSSSAVLALDLPESPLSTGPAAKELGVPEVPSAREQNLYLQTAANLGSAVASSSADSRYLVTDDLPSYMVSITRINSAAQGGLADEVSPENVAAVVQAEVQRSVATAEEQVMMTASNPKSAVTAHQQMVQAHVSGAPYLLQTAGFTAGLVAPELPNVINSQLGSAALPADATKDVDIQAVTDAVAGPSATLMGSAPDLSLDGLQTELDLAQFDGLPLTANDLAALDTLPELDDMGELVEMADLELLDAASAVELPIVEPELSGQLNALASALQL